MKIKPIYIPVLVAFILAVGILVGSLLDFPSKIVPFKPTNTSRDKIDRLIYFIENEYVDNVNTDSIIENTVNGILSQLDPHSVYIGKDEFGYVEESMRGNFVGIGINFYMYKDTLTVIRTIEDGPSEKVGIKAGDRILIADNDTIFGKNFSSDSIVSKLRGEQKSKLKVRVLRKTENKKYDFIITRDVIPLKSVDISLKINENTGYIKVNRFAETTAKEFHSALQELKKQNLKTLIVDLRDNGGGYVDAAIAMADEFLKEDELIVVTKDKRGTEDKAFATKKGLFESGKLFVLINENSASSSEILAGAIQDNDRGTIVGKLSYGKGLVQREMPLGDGSVVRLTVAQYYTPTGRSIQKPYKNISEEEYYNHFSEEKKEYKPNDSLKFTTKGGKIVYGGGGIYPDILSEDNSENESVVFMMNSALSSNFVFEVIDKKRADFLQMSESEIKNNLKKNDFYFNEFKDYLKDKNIHLPLEKNKATIEKYLKAEFVRQLFSEEDYYKILLEDDVMIKQILN